MDHYGPGIALWNIARCGFSAGAWGVIVLVAKIESLGKLEVKLDGTALPLAAQSIEDGDINLWAVAKANQCY